MNSPLGIFYAGQSTRGGRHGQGNLNAYGQCARLPFLMITSMFLHMFGLNRMASGQWTHADE